MMDVSAAAAAIARGELVVYPTETVYGLGGDAFSTAAIDRVFALKHRPLDMPLSVAVSEIDSVETIARPSGRTVTFMREFLPGPVTVVCDKHPNVPDALTGGSGRVGVRIPDHELALAFLAEAGPVTATSANVSGTDSVRTLGDLSSRIREGAAVVLDGGETGGGASTVVDVDRGTIHRPGAMVDEVRAWLADDAYSRPSP